MDENLQEQEATWGVILKFWWAWTWRSFVLAMLLSLVLGFVMGLFAKMIGIDMRSSILFVNLSSIVVSLPVTFYMLKKVFAKDFGSFRIAIIKKNTI